LAFYHCHRHVKIDISLPVGVGDYSRIMGFFNAVNYLLQGFANEGFQFHVAPVSVAAPFNGKVLL
jgi:hypothetical protein